LNEPKIYEGETVPKFCGIVFFLYSFNRFGVVVSSLDLIEMPTPLDLCDFTDKFLIKLG
jgi:hypothetical protein